MYAHIVGSSNFTLIFERQGIAGKYAMHFSFDDYAEISAVFTDPILARISESTDILDGQGGDSYTAWAEKYEEDGGMHWYFSYLATDDEQALITARQIMVMLGRPFCVVTDGNDWSENQQVIVA